MDQDLNSEEIDDRFYVRGRMEILNVLNDLVYRCEPVTVSFNHETDHLATTLLEAKDAALIFELSDDDASNRRLLMHPTCSMVAYPDGIRVQFSVSRISRISWGDSDAFSAPLPECVVRLQRQLSFRIVIPAETTLSVRLTADGGASLGEWLLHDLSVGGLGVTVDEQWRLAPGQKIARASLTLPDYGAIDCAVTLRHETDLAEAAQVDLNAPCRIGLAFVDLLPEIGAAIQRYIINIEHERRSTAADQGADGNY